MKVININKKLRVLFISHSDAGQGGAPKSLCEMVLSLKKNYNVDPIVCVHAKDAVYSFCKKNGIECYVTGHEDIWVGRKINPLSWLKFIPHKIKLILCNRKALNILKSKIDLNTVSIIHSNVSVVNLGMYINKKTGIPHIMHIREDAALLNRMLYVIRPIFSMREYVTRYIAVSSFVKENWINKGLSRDKVDRVYNGLRLPAKLYHDILKNKKSIRMIIIGSLQESKGQLYVIKAIESLKINYKNKVSLDIVGVGNKSYSSKIKKYLVDHKIKNVHLLGYDKNITDKLNEYDIGIMASKGEAFGRVTVEYMANGLIVLASKAGANSEIIDDKETGLLFDRLNITSLSEKIEWVINNVQLSKKIARKGQEKAYKLFTTDINTKNIYNEYKKVIKEKR